MSNQTSQGEELTESEVGQPVGCEHYWVIGQPSGPSSNGICKECGEEREFLNYWEGSSWGNDVSLEQLSGGSRIPMDIGSKVGVNVWDNEDES